MSAPRFTLTHPRLSVCVCVCVILPLGTFVTPVRKTQVLNVASECDRNLCEPPKGQRKSRHQKPSTKQATQGGRPGEIKPSDFFFLTLGAFTAKSQRFFLLSAPSGRKASVFCSRRLFGASPSRRPSVLPGFPLPGPRHALAGSGFWLGVYNHANNKHTHTTPSQLLLFTCHRTRNRRFCISAWSFLSQPLQPQPIRAREH